MLIDHKRCRLDFVWLNIYLTNYPFLHPFCFDFGYDQEDVGHDFMYSSQQRRQQIPKSRPFPFLSHESKKGSRGHRIEQIILRRRTLHVDFSSTIIPQTQQMANAH